MNEPSPKVWDGRLDFGPKPEPKLSEPLLETPQVVSLTPCAPSVDTGYAKVLPINTETVKIIEWQQRAIEELVQKYREGKIGAILRGGTGLGKMYIASLTIRKLLEQGILTKPADSFNPFPVLWLCPKTAKLQTQRVLKDCGIAHLVMVLSYGQLKRGDGVMFLEYKTELVAGQPTIKPIWMPQMRPAMIKADERQMLKNPDALITRIVVEKPQDVKWLEVSATPWQRVQDAHSTVICCGVKTKYNALPCTRAVAPSLLRAIAHPKHPSKYSPSTVKRLREAIEDYIVELKNVRFKFNSRTIQTVIQFVDRQQRIEYEQAYEQYLREVAEGKRRGRVEHGQMALLVAMQKFKEKASLLRSPQLADKAVERVKQGHQVILGSDYITTLRSVWVHLVKRHNFDRNRIGFIVGGQSEKERQGYVDAFQEGRLDILLITVRSGGVAISLHHDRPESRPRYVIVPPTWSAIDLVQYLGRAHRLTSISPTIQEVLWFDGTIESERVMPYVKNKVKCLAQAVTAQEQFIAMFDRVTQEEQEAASDEVVEAMGEAQGESQQDDPDDVETDAGVTGEGLDSDDTLPTEYR